VHASFADLGNWNGLANATVGNVEFDVATSPLMSTPDRGKKCGGHGLLFRCCRGETATSSPRGAFRLCACRFNVRLQRASPSGFERARSAVGVGLSRGQNVYPADIALIFPAKTGKPRKYNIPNQPPVSAEALLAEGKWQRVSCGGAPKVG
jgi:hypothetical protein